MATTTKKRAKELEAKKLRALALIATTIIENYEAGAKFDRHFDGGEFSGPATARAEQEALEEFAAVNGVTMDALESAMLTLANELQDEDMRNAGLGLVQ